MAKSSMRGHALRKTTQEREVLSEQTEETKLMIRTAVRATVFTAGVVINYNLVLEAIKEGRLLCLKEENEMIVLNVTYTCKPDMREEFLEMIITEGIDAASRAEEGNIKYDYYLPVDNSDEMLLVEKWRDAEALAEHARQPHFKRLGELKAEFVQDTVIERFERQD